MTETTRWVFVWDGYFWYPQRIPRADPNLVTAVDTILTPACDVERADMLVDAWAENEANGVLPCRIGTEGGIAERVSAREVRLQDLWNQFEDTVMAADEFAGVLDAYAHALRTTPVWTFTRREGRPAGYRLPETPACLRTVAEMFLAPLTSSEQVEALLDDWREQLVDEEDPYAAESGGVVARRLDGVRITLTDLSKKFDVVWVSNAEFEHILDAYAKTLRS
ncbi:hypothetical protein [Streptodolium elevatio]|uniref:Uncharacterized protein n=1 Tax=Streptodolium elevatio TaxID=3157996 RepID=A0ABV3DFE1_9ACTN